MAKRRTDPAQHPFTKAIAGALRGRCRLGASPDGSPSRVVLAVSGGADSVALLRSLVALSRRRGWRLTIAVGHVQHHLRADRLAERDARFVERLSAKLRVPYFRADLDATPRQGGKSPRDNTEAWARRERYAALLDIARAFHAEAIITAHHADDQLETVLMRLLRGASVRGLAGMAWRRRVAPRGGEAARFADETIRRSPHSPGFSRGGITIHEATPAKAGAIWNRADGLLLLRPMLAVTRADAEAFLRSLRQRWCTDHTNADRTRLRARLRRDVLPVLTAIRADAPHRAVALAAHLRQVAHVLDTQIARAADRVLVEKDRATLDRVEAVNTPAIVLTGVIRRLLLEAGVPADRAGNRTLAPIVRAARDNVGGTRRFTLANCVSVTITRETVCVTCDL